VPRIAGLDFGHGFHKVEIQAESIRGAFLAPNDLREGSGVRFGSKADICSAKGDIGFTPESGHVRYI